MKEHKYHGYIYWGITAVLVIVSCILVAVAFLRWQALRQAVSKLNAILAPVTYGAVLAYLTAPVYNQIRNVVEKQLERVLKKKKQRVNIAKALATAGSVALLVLVVMGLCSMLIPQLWESVKNIINSIPGYTVIVSEWIEETFNNNPDVETAVMNFYNQAVAKLMSWTEGVSEILPNIEKVVTGVYLGIINVVTLLKNLLIGVIVMIYLLNIKETLCAQSKKIIYGLFSVPAANEIVEKFRFVNQVFGGFIIGKLVDSLIIGIITFVWLSIIKMPYTLLISVIIGVTNVIPFFGPFIGAVPSAFLLLLMDPKKCVWFLLSILVIQQFDGNILGPRILGNSTGVSSFWVLFSILFFGGILGPVGMIIGVPAFAVIYRLLSEYINKRLARKQLSTNTKDYGELDHIDADKKTYIR